MQITNDTDSKYKFIILETFRVGAECGLKFQFSQTNESKADEIGVI